MLGSRRGLLWVAIMALRSRFGWKHLSTPKVFWSRHLTEYSNIFDVEDVVSNRTPTRTRINTQRHTCGHPYGDTHAHAITGIVSSHQFQPDKVIREEIDASLSSNCHQPIHLNGLHDDIRLLGLCLTAQQLYMQSVWHRNPQIEKNYSPWVVLSIDSRSDLLLNTKWITLTQKFTVVFVAFSSRNIFSKRITNRHFQFLNWDFSRAQFLHQVEVRIECVNPLQCFQLTGNQYFNKSENMAGPCLIDWIQHEMACWLFQVSCVKRMCKWIQCYMSMRSRIVVTCSFYNMKTMHNIKTIQTILNNIIIAKHWAYYFPNWSTRQNQLDGFFSNTRKQPCHWT